MEYKIPLTTAHVKPCSLGYAWETATHQQNCNKDTYQKNQFLVKVNSSIQSNHVLPKAWRALLTKKTITALWSSFWACSFIICSLLNENCKHGLWEETSYEMCISAFFLLATGHIPIQTTAEEVRLWTFFGCQEAAPTREPASCLYSDT